MKGPHIIVASPHSLIAQIEYTRFRSTKLIKITIVEINTNIQHRRKRFSNSISFISYFFIFFTFLFISTFFYSLKKEIIDDSLLIFVVFIFFY